MSASGAKPEKESTQETQTLSDMLASLSFHDLMTLRDQIVTEMLRRTGRRSDDTKRAG
jgi:hypothetical protein